MSWSPINAGNGQSSHHTFTTDTGTFVLTGLQNSVLALHLEDMNNNNALYICTGQWSITDAPNGKADFTPSATDLLAANPFGRAGVYLAYPVVTLTTGPVAMDGQIIEVKARP